MERFRFPLAVALTSLALVTGALVLGGFFVTNAVASTPLGSMFMAGRGMPPWMAGGDHGGWHNGTLPPQLASLMNVPAGERFSHFRGAQLEVTDSSNVRHTISVTPGVVAAASANSVTLTGNDGQTRIFAIDSNTMSHGPRTRPSAGEPAVAKDDNVVVMTLDGSSTATAILDLRGADRGPWGPHGS